VKRQRHRWKAVAALCVGLAFVAVVRWIATAGGPGGYTATVTIDTAGTSFGAINGQYIGLSFESGTLDSGKFDDAGDLAQLLRNLVRQSPVGS
jgi:hypothetical protein